MKIHRFEKEIWLPHPPDEVFAFFADAHNLQVITPPWLRFEVATEGEIAMETGTIIEYKLRLHGIPLRWVSEIIRWEPPRVFVDEQRKGPYRQWIHEHRFAGKDGGTLAEDVIRYAVPGGALIHRMLVRRDVIKIFDYREKKLKKLFPG